METDPEKLLKRVALVGTQKDLPSVDDELMKSYVCDELARARRTTRRRLLTKEATEMVRENIVRFSNWSDRHAQLLVKLGKLSP